MVEEKSYGNQNHRDTQEDENVAFSIELDDLKKFHRHRLLPFKWYEDNY